MARRIKWTVFAALCLSWPAIAAAGLLDPPAKAWVAPGRLFSLELPPEWGVVLHEDDPYTYDLKPLNPGIDASLRIQRRLVPRGASPRHLMLREIDHRTKKLPAYETLHKQSTRIAGYKGATVSARYAFQGNIQFPRFLQHTYVVVGEEAFVFSFECYEPMAHELAPVVLFIYDKFIARPAGVSDDPFAVPQDTPSPAVQNLPF